MNRSAVLSLLAITVFLLIVPLTPPKPGLPATLKADESAYYLMALSLAHDLDLRVETWDVDRLFAEFPYLPVRNLVVMSDDGWNTVYFGKPLLYPLFAAPFALIFGANGLVFFNMALLLGMVWLGAIYLRRFNSDSLAVLFSCGFFFLSAGFAYVFWIQTEIFSMAAVTGSCFLAVSAGTGRARWPWQVALSGALLAMAVYNKPPILLLCVPLIWWVGRRHWREAVTWTLGLLIALGLSGGLSLALTGKPSAYLGSQQRTGVTVCEPGVMPIEPIAAGTRGRVEVTSAAASATGNTFSWLYRIPRIDASVLESVRYFLWGRHTGFLLYLPFAALAILLLALEGPRDSRRWLLLAALTGIAGYFVVFMPVNWQGGGGFIGNRYFINVYPAFLFLVRRVQRQSLVVPFYGLAGLFLGPLVLSPYATLGPEPTLQAHVRNAPFRFFPLELSLRHLPGYHKERAGSLRYISRRDQALARGPGAVWARGADRVELWIESAQPLGPLVFQIENFAATNEVEVAFGRDRVQLEFEDGPQSRRVTLDPGKPRQVRTIAGGKLLVYRVVIQSSSGAVRHWTRIYPPNRCSYFAYESSREESFYVGAGLTLLGDAGSLDRDVFALEWGEIEVPSTVTVGEVFRIRTRVRNTSAHDWDIRFSAGVGLAYHWLDAEGNVVVKEGRRTRPRKPVAPGELLQLSQTIEAPAAAGDYILELDPVFEHVAWFAERTGGDTYRRPVRVVAAAGP